MKKLLTLIFALLLALCLLACGQITEQVPVEFTFPEGCSVLGVNISGMTKEAAWSAVEAKTTGYTATISVDGVEAVVTAQDIDLTCSREIFMACADAREQKIIPDYTGLISFNEGKLRLFVSQHFNKDVTEAAITFDEASGQYILIPHADGQSSNPNAIVDGVKDAIMQLSAPNALTGLSEILHPVRSADDPEIIQALEAVNKMLTTQLTYTFSPGGNDTDHTISSEDIRSFVGIGEDGITPIINDDTLDTYIASLEEKYSLSGTKGDFKSTPGDTIDMTVSYNGHLVDGDALKQDLVDAIKEGASGNRTAPYKASGNRDMAYGGTYIEVNLTKQHLWFYKNGECLVSTDLVSGNVSDDCCTPTGIYAIYAKSTETYLVGENYRSFVNYWMPFHYGYGLHDATWRGSFGGSIYKYSGSHGCLNLPLKAASKIYKNASVGTKVIIYGGATTVPNSFKGTKSYDVAEDVGSFKLSIKPKYSGGAVTYTSSNTDVATVSSNGTVTVHKIGEATITVKVAKHATHEAASTKVTVKVHSVCDEGRHPSLGEWKTVTEATCGKDGQKQRTCSACGKKETEAIPATGNHTEGSWVTTKAPTCTEEGSRKLECAVCGTQLKTESIPATGTHEAGDWKTVTEATCTETGLKQQLCKTCPKVMAEEVIPAKGHSYEWKTTQAATCTESGTQVQTCKCGATGESRTVDAKGHSFGSGATCDNCSEPNPNAASSEATETTAAE